MNLQLRYDLYTATLAEADEIEEIHTIELKSEVAEPVFA